MSSPESQYTSIADIDKIYARVSQTWKAGKTRPLEYRRRQLLQLARMVQENSAAFEKALHDDLGKQPLETASCETGPVVMEAIRAAEKLEEWTQPEKPKTEEWRSNWDTSIYPVPKGPVLIISPWNYPVILSLATLVGAIAAGCPTVLKPSEMTSAVSALFAELFPKYLDHDAYAVVQGAVVETSRLLEFRWNHIMYTGSGRVGRIVAAAAAKHITPTTLELGGKSPVIISPDCDIELAAKRVLFGKVQNSGQLCVSPDYVLVPRSIADAFKSSLKKAYDSFFPTDPLAPESSWSRIINDAQHRRLMNLIQTTQGTILTGGVADNKNRIAITIVGDVKLDDPLMEDELFGPILPIIEVENTDEAIDIVADRPSPLVLYLFTQSEELKQQVLSRTSSGGFVMNDTVYHIVVHEMPFGGHGDSGYGSCFGKNSFDTFTHRRSFINVPAEIEPFYAYRYLPYTEEGYKVLGGSVHAKIPDA